MNLVAAILLIGATGHAERSMETDASIGRIVAQCGNGMFNDLRHSGIDIGPDWLRRAASAANGIALRLTIDGQPREGLRAWGEAAWRVGGYVADVRSTGSVGYRYRLRIRGYDIRRETRISDGRVLLTTDAWWTETVPVTRRITRRVPVHVTIVLRGEETGEGSTTITGSAVGAADPREFQCGLVRRIAERQASQQLRDGLADALATVQRKGTAFYHGGDELAGVLDRIRLSIRIAGIAGRLRR